MSVLRGTAAVAGARPVRGKVAEAVEKVLTKHSQSNNRIRSVAGLNHCCAVRPVRESILRLGPLKILFQQPQPEEDIRSPYFGMTMLVRF